MIRLLASATLIALTLAAAPSFAASKGASGGTIPANCTMDPFEHVYTCFNRVCHKDGSGRRVCTVTTTKTPY